MSSAMSFSFQGDQSSGDIFMRTKHRKKEEGKQKEKKSRWKRKKEIQSYCLSLPFANDKASRSRIHYWFGLTPSSVFIFSWWPLELWFDRLAGRRTPQLCHFEVDPRNGNSSVSNHHQMRRKWQPNCRWPSTLIGLKEVIWFPIWQEAQCWTVIKDVLYGRLWNQYEPPNGYPPVEWTWAGRTARARWLRYG